MGRREDEPIADVETDPGGDLAIVEREAAAFFATLLAREEVIYPASLTPVSHFLGAGSLRSPLRCHVTGRRPRLATTATLGVFLAKRGINHVFGILLLIWEAAIRDTRDEVLEQFLVLFPLEPVLHVALVAVVDWDQSFDAYVIPAPLFPGIVDLEDFVRVAGA
jgi:hypothetical protein